MIYIFIQILVKKLKPTIIKETPIAWFSIGGDASGIAKTEIASIGWIDGDFQTSILRDGVWMDCKATGYVLFLGKKLELTPWYKKIQIIDPD